MVYKATEEALAKSDEERHIPVKETADYWMGSEEGVNDFDRTVVKFDDYKIAVKYYRCPVFDSVKDMEDREVAYLSYCWTRVPEEELTTKSRRMLTPQTLYDSNYCVEFFWNNDVHSNAQPPTDEFWNSINDEEGD
jgi:hypothetical protein